MNIIAIAQTIALIGDIVNVVTQYVERCDDPTVTTSTAKKELAMKMTESIYSASEPAVPFVSYVNQASQMIDGLVAFNHAAGRFTKTGTGAAVAA